MMLDEFSKMAEQLILDRFPEWRTCAERHDARDGSEYLIFRVPRPAATDSYDGIAIRTSIGEFTVEVKGRIHWHFDTVSVVDFADLSEDQYGEDWAGLFNCIDAIVNEDVVLDLSTYTMIDARTAPNSLDADQLWSWTGRYEATVDLEAVKTPGSTDS